MCQVGASDEGHSSSMVFGQSNDCKWVFNEVSLAPWCHAVVRLGVKRSHFSTCFPNNCPIRSG